MEGGGIPQVRIERRCERCGNEFVMRDSDARRYRAKINGVSYELFVLVCPRCNDAVIVQVDDERSAAILSDITRMLAERGAHGRPGKIEKIKMQKLQKSLKNRRLDLMQRLEGKTFNLLNPDGKPVRTMMEARADYEFIR